MQYNVHTAVYVCMCDLCLAIVKPSICINCNYVSDYYFNLNDTLEELFVCSGTGVYLELTFSIPGNCEGILKLLRKCDSTL